VVVVTWSVLAMTSSSQHHHQQQQPERLVESDAKRLYDDLLKKNAYNSLIRPVDNTSESLTVHIGLRLTSIIDIVSRSVAGFAPTPLGLLRLVSLLSAR